MWCPKGEFILSYKVQEDIEIFTDWILGVRGIGACFIVVCLFNPLTPKISSVILLTVCHSVLVRLVWRIWYWINL